MLSDMSSFETARLSCRSLSLDEYQTYESGLEPGWDGFSNPYKHLIEGPNPMRHRIPRVNADPSFAEIGLFIAVEKASGEIVGSSGFHDFPDANGMIEIGYGIVPQKQNQGFGKELLLGSWNWISSFPGVKTLRYTVAPDNAPSIHVIQSLSFDFKGEQIDPEDGVELIYELEIEKYLKVVGAEGFEPPTFSV